MLLWLLINPVQVSTLQSLFRVTNLKQECPLIGGKVYWCARDLDGLPLGNHQFILIVFDNKKSADKLGVPYVTEGSMYFVTLGGFENDPEKYLEHRRNYKVDVLAVREGYFPEKYRKTNKADYDIEKHLVPPPDGQTEESFIRKITSLADNFDQNDHVEKFPYSLQDNNCSAWVNTLLKLAGVGTSERETLGEFDGVDWGEEDEVPEKLFQ